MPSILKPDQQFASHLTLAGDPVELLWLIPLTPAECQHKLDHGMSAIFDLFDQHQHPFIFNPTRSSYV